ncbi:conserved unknown protein [Ectocarpus siliculosus]|uniref:Thymus-specific serine protease n=1 Tax=Ectocarpus siliculosus TaxID=2880 RepID=D8LTJ9_ECTSI|nr:conserved unknown protein [Ectocarpus siliculosus]|eukprot:CBN78040.1 conserved unknown protein [Ectocarpus siliculosus]
MRIPVYLLAGLGLSTCATGLPRLGVDGPIRDDPGAADSAEGLVAAAASRLGALLDPLVDNGIPRGDVEELFVEQRLDHFDRQNSRKFLQRYFINKKYWAGASSGAPVFLCVGGEGPPLEANVLSESVHCNDMLELAPEHNALVLAVEHRYYGKSNPGDDWATDSLRWLSSQQALADLSSFHGFLSDKEGLTGAEKWVTWGGSYPGMLAGWARLKYPHLFHAAVSSSSPMKAQLDFPQYAEVMRDSLASGVDGVGGSEECASAVEAGHASIGELLLTEEGQLELVATFQLCDASSLQDEDARVLFAGDGVVTLPIQGNDPACNGMVCNIRAVCEIMTDATRGSEVERLAAIRKIQRSSDAEAIEEPRSSPSPCEVFPPKDMNTAAGRYGGRSRERGAGLRRDYPGQEMKLLGRWAMDPSDPDRAWLYQTCTEFGFYQTCEVGTRCPFTQGLHTLDLDLAMCEEAFGIRAEEVREQVRLTNLFYGGDRPRGSRVIFPNGAIDPWHALGVLETPTPGLPAIYVEGASHHFWTHPSKPTDSPDIVKARHVIWNQVTAWLGEDD